MASTISVHLNIQYDIRHGNIDAGLDKFIAITAHFACLNIFDHTADLMAAAQLANALPATVGQADASFFSGHQ